jgi:spore germination protein YaaH
MSIMRTGPRGLLVTVGLALVLAGCSFGPQAAPKRGPQSSAGQKSKPDATGPAQTGSLKVIAFYDASGSPAPPDPFSLLQSHPGLVTDISPFWFKVNSDGSIATRPQGNVAALVAQQHMGLVPLFNNAKGEDTFLHTAALRSTVIHNIVGLVTKQHYAGVNIDFQGLKPTDRTDLTLFMDQLYRQMPKSTLLSMSVVPLTNLNGPRSAYNYAALDHVVGAMVLMAYDLHGNGTGPGPVSPIAWVARSIRLAIKAGVKPSKLYLGIANYGYDWAGSSTTAATVPLKVMHAHQYGTYTWVSQYAEGKDTFTQGGVTHTIWFVPDRGAVARINLAKQYHLGGVAFWRIGYEDAKWWNAVATALGRPSTTGASRRPAGKRTTTGQPGAGARTGPKAGTRNRTQTRRPIGPVQRTPQHKGRPA